MKHFKLKDVVTTLNLFLSFYAVILAFSGKFELASYLLVLNILVLDVIDGLVARLTKSSNEFGKHFDSITDFIGSSIAVSFFVYIALWETNYIVAVICAFSFLFVGVMREVRSRIENISYKGYFIGFPRNSACLVLVAFFNTTLFDFSPLLIIPYLVILGFFQLSHVPFVGNDKPILMKIPRARNYIIAGVFYIAINSYFGFFWNSVLTIMCCYLFSSYFLVERKVWDDVKRQVAELGRG